MRQFTDHQRNSFRLFSNDKNQQFDINNRVLIKSKRKAFHKQSAIYSSDWSGEIFVIRRISRDILPYIYHLSHENDNHEVKHLYAHEMTKYDFTPTSVTDSPRLKIYSDPLDEKEMIGKIFVTDVTFKEPTRLRSGKKITAKSIPYYRVTINGRKDILPEAALRLLKKSVGNSVIYGQFFNEIENAKYII